MCVALCSFWPSTFIYGNRNGYGGFILLRFFSRFFYFNISAVILLFAYNNWVRCSMENKKNRYDSEMQLNILAQQRIPINQTSFFWSRAREPSANETQTNHIQWERERERGSEGWDVKKSIHTERTQWKESDSIEISVFPNSNNMWISFFRCCRSRFSSTQFETC